MGRLSRMMAVLAVSAVVAMLSALPAIALAQSFSEFHRFIGTATLDGTLVPVGADITAFDGTRLHWHREGDLRRAVCAADHPGLWRHRLQDQPRNDGPDLRQLEAQRRIHRLPPYGHYSRGPDAGHGRGSGVAGTCGSGRASWSPGRAGSARPGG